MIRLNEIKMPLGTTELEVKKEVSKILKINISLLEKFKDRCYYAQLYQGVYKGRYWFY